MSRRIVLAGFAREEDLLQAVRSVQNRGWEIADVYTPYAVHGLEQVLGWPRSRLAVACFLGGAAGVVSALWFQFWTTGWNWPLNVGGQPWNSLPAFVPGTFESMVLLAGFTLVFAWIFRSGLYPGKASVPLLAGLTDDRFGMLLRFPDPVAAGAAREVLQQCHADRLEERGEEEPQ